MSEIAKCRCGAEATLNSPCVRGEAPFTHFVDCERCGSSGPNEDSPAEAIAAWNDLMRPRPVAEWVPAQGLRGDEPHGFVGSFRLGQVVLGHVSVHGIVAARCHIDGKGQYFLDSASARAWLVTQVRAAGIEVREES